MLKLERNRDNLALCHQTVGINTHKVSVNYYSGKNLNHTHNRASTVVCNIKTMHTIAYEWIGLI